MEDFRSKALNAENCLIGAALLAPSWLTESDLQPCHFMQEANGNIWQAILALHRENTSIDLVTVDAELKRNGVKCAAYLSQLCRQTPSAENWLAYQDIVKTHSERVRTLDVLTGGVASVNDGTLDRDKIISLLMDIDSEERNHSWTAGEMLNSTIDHLDAVASGKIQTLSTGLADMDEILGGFHNSDLIVVAGRPAMGKTAMLLNMIHRCGAQVGLMSSEQPKEQIGMRLISMGGKVPVSKMRSGKFEPHEWARITGAVAGIQRGALRVNDHPTPTIVDVQKQARLWKHRHGIKALYVDYIQRIKATDTKKPRHEQVGEIARGLKNLARELDIPVIALAQVSRAVEARPNKRPNMGDISDSSEVEKEADQILTLYRDEVYDENTTTPGIIEIDIKKNRHGACGGITAYWRGEHMIVEDVTNKYEGGYG